MNLMDCEYNRHKLCEQTFFDELIKRNCKECEIYKQEMSLIQCLCNFIAEESKWIKIKDNSDTKLIACPKCGTIKLLTENTHKWRKQEDDMLLR